MPKASLLQILVVDDQRSMRALVRSSLQQCGCSQITEAENGLDALSRLELLRTDLIISDLNMPVLDGLELLRAVRGSETLKDSAFIMLTTSGDGDFVRQAMALRVNNYLMKPFSVDGLRRKVEAVVGPLT